MLLWKHLAFFGDLPTWSWSEKLFNVHWVAVGMNACQQVQAVLAGIEDGHQTSKRIRPAP
jgi:hypothetical protein